MTSKEKEITIIEIEEMPKIKTIPSPDKEKIKEPEKKEVEQ